jgi:hypothetical protein
MFERRLRAVNVNTLHDYIVDLSGSHPWWSFHQLNPSGVLDPLPNLMMFVCTNGFCTSVLMFVAQFTPTGQVCTFHTKIPLGCVPFSVCVRRFLRKEKMIWHWSTIEINQLEMSRLELLWLVTNHEKIQKVLWRASYWVGDHVGMSRQPL